MFLKKKYIIIIATLFFISGCSKAKRNPGRSYMPDMAYSRAYETYAALDSSRFTSSYEERGEGKIFYNARPVEGSRARGDMPVFPFNSDTVNYTLSRSYTNPLPKPDSVQMKEAERLYMVNCGICHGPKLDGNGPLYNGGNGPFPARPRNLLEPEMKSMGDGTMYHVVTYGKGQMGSYASQLNSRQRWMVIHYVRERQMGTAAKDTAATTTAGASGVKPKDPGN